MTSGLGFCILKCAKHGCTNCLYLPHDLCTEHVLVINLYDVFKCTGLKCNSVVRMFTNGAMGRQIDPSCHTLSYFSFQPVLHDWCNKGHGMCYSVCGMMHIKDPLLLIRKSSPCEFPLSLSVSDAI